MLLIAKNTKRFSILFISLSPQAILSYYTVSPMKHQYIVPISHPQLYDRQKRMENGVGIGKEYFEHLIGDIQDIHQSGRRFYQELIDIYATRVVYNIDARTTHELYKKVQNKIDYVIHRKNTSKFTHSMKRSNELTFYIVIIFSSVF